MTPKALDWSNVAPLPKGWVSDDVPGAAGKILDVAKSINANALVNYDKVIIDRNKITEYTLNKSHPVGGPKALLIDQLLGYDTRRSDEFIQFLRDQLPRFSATEKSSNLFGAKYEVVMKVPDLKGRTVKLVTAWIIDSGADPRFKYTGIPRFVSAYIKK